MDHHRPGRKLRAVEPVGVLIAAVVLAAGCGSGSSAAGSSTSAAEPGPPSATPTSASDGSVSAQRVGAEVVVEVPVGIRPTRASVDGGRLWVASELSAADEDGVALRDDGWGSVTVIDTATGTIEASVDLDVSDPTRVTRGASPASVAPDGDGGVWVVSQDWEGPGYLQHVDVRTGVIGEVPTGGLGPTAAAADPNGRTVWVCDYEADANGQSPPRLIELDPATGEILTSASLRGPGVDVVVAEDSVWVRSVLERSDGLITRFDAAADVVTDTLEFVDLGGIALAPDGAVWASTGSEIVRVDPVTLETTGRIDVAQRDDRLGPVAVTDDAVWVLEPRAATVHRVDPAASAVTDVVRVPDQAVALTADGSDIWVLSHLREDGKANSTIPGVATGIGIR